MAFSVNHPDESHRRVVNMANDDDHPHHSTHPPAVLVASAQHQPIIHHATGTTTTTMTSSTTTTTTTTTAVRRHTTIEHVPVAPKVNSISFFCGLLAGVTQAGLFNPFDRALYLSVKNDIPFLRWQNFQNPYQGFSQSVGLRALSGGLYYPLEQFFVTLWMPVDFQRNDESKYYGAIYNFAAGTAAGSVNALICNPISAIKYKTWGREVNQGMVKEALEMLRKGGLRPFGNGLIPTVLRDLVFGGCYTFMRFELQYRLQLSTEYQWAANLVAAALATIVSGPFNLARNVQYATKSRHVADSVGQVMIQLIQETSQRPTVYEKCKFVQNRLRIGWGTARVAVGMAFGNFVYDRLAGLYEESRSSRR